MRDEYQSIHKELKKLKTRNRIVEVSFSLLVLMLLTLSFSSYNFNDSKDIIRVKGIIVEDENGNERIIIGAPVPFAKNRARTDSSKIKNTWGKRMGSKYMDWYKEYSHEANGIIILDEDGWDKIVIGDPAPDPIFGKRIGPSTGVILNDDQGQERSGYAILKVNGEDRVCLGLDNKNGTEGATLSVMRDGSVGLNLNSEKQKIYLGTAKPENWNSPNGENFHGLLIKDKEEKLITSSNNN